MRCFFYGGPKDGLWKDIELNGPVVYFTKDVDPYLFVNQLTTDPYEVAFVEKLDYHLVAKDEDGYHFSYNTKGGDV